MSSKLQWRWILVSVQSFCCVIAGAQSKKADAAATAKAERLCGSCHEMSIATSVRHSKEEWAAIVDDMISRGMKASPEDVKFIINYLAEHYGTENSSGSL
jgi:hypothetical protein